MIDNNSDPWVFEQLSKELMKKVIELHGTIQWTDLMYVILLLLLVNF